MREFALKFQPRLSDGVAKSQETRMERLTLDRWLGGPRATVCLVANDRARGVAEVDPNLMGTTSGQAALNEGRHTPEATKRFVPGECCLAAAFRNHGHLLAVAFTSTDGAGLASHCWIWHPPHDGAVGPAD